MSLGKIATRLGYKNAVSFQKLYKGGCPNTFGYPKNSISYFTIHQNKDKNIIKIEVNKTYFSESKQVLKVNSFCSYDNPKSINEVLTFLSLK